VINVSIVRASLARMNAPSTFLVTVAMCAYEPLASSAMAAGTAVANSEATAKVKTMAGRLAALPRQLLSAGFIQLFIMSPFEVFG
jgi:hypothetical protein